MRYLLPILFLLYSQTCYAQQQRQDYAESVKFDFRGGMNLNARQFDNQARLIQNAYLQKDGTLQVRGGQSIYTNAGAASGSIEALYGRYDTTNGVQVTVVKREDNQNDLVYENSTQVTGVNFGTGNYTSIAEYKETIFLSNGDGAVAYYTPGATTLALISGSPTPPTGKHMLIYKDRMYIAGTDGSLYWSNVGVYTTLPTTDFPALNFIVIGRAGNPVTALRAAQDFLVAFTESAYHIMTGVPDDDGGSGDMDWETFHGVGCIWPRTVAISERTVIFIAPSRRIYSLTNTLLEDLDPNDYIREYMLDATNSVMDVVSLYVRNQYIYIYVPVNADKTNGRLLVYDRFLKAWVVFTNINGYSFTEVKAQRRFFVGSASSGAIWEQDDGENDYGTDIPFVFESKQEPLGMYRRDKRYMAGSIQMEFSSIDSVNVKYSADEGAYTAIEDVYNFSGGALSGNGKTWGDENWGDSTWGGPGTTQDGYFAFASSTANVNAKIVRIKVSGDLKAGSSFLSYHIDGITNTRNK